MLIQLTRDHSLVQAMVDRGEITLEEAAIHPLRHQITRVVGGDDVISPEIASQTLEPGDMVLLCTDGLSGLVDPDTIKSVLAAGATTAQQKADVLVKAALEAGGADNITVVVVSYQRPHSTAHRQQPRAHKPPHLPHWQSWWLAVLCLVVLCLAVLVFEYTHPRYYVAPDTQGMMALYRDWPLLHMLHKEHILVHGQYTISLDDARPYLKPYLKNQADVYRGIEMKEGRYEGVAFLSDLAKQIRVTLLDQSRTDAEKGDVGTAQRLLDRARTLGAPTVEVNQLELQIQKAMHKQQAPKGNTPKPVVPPHP